MIILSDNLNFLYNDELTVLRLRKLYEDRGFKKFRMSKFESYDFYAKNKEKYKFSDEVTKIIESLLTLVQQSINELNIAKSEEIIDL